MRCAGVLAILCLRALAQDAAPCAVSGVVTDEATNKPVVRARVIATTNTYSFLQLTEERGRFCFKELTPADYHLLVQMPGYVELFHPVTLAVEQDSPVKPLAIRITRSSSISGTVLDADGELQPGADVTVWERTRTGPNQVHSATTDARGSFHMSQLAPGIYYLSAKYEDQDDRTSLPFADSHGRMPRTKEIETFYSASFTFSGATPVEVKAGEQIKNMVLTLGKAALRRVTGRIADLPHSGFLTYYSETETGSGEGGAIPIASDGTFVKADLPPAKYTFLLGDGRKAIALKEVDLTLGDAAGITLDRIETADIPTVIRTEGKGPEFRPRPGTSDFMLVQAGSNEAMGLEAVNDGTYRFSGVPRGIYQLHVELAEHQLYVKNVTYGGETQTGDKIDLRSAREGGLEITLSPNVAKLQGSVAISDDASEELTIVLVDGAQIIHETGTDQKGRFQIAAVAPGKYRLYAIEGFDDGEWGRPELAKALEAKSVELELKESETKQVSVPAISAGEWAAALKKLGG